MILIDNLMKFYYAIYLRKLKNAMRALIKITFFISFILSNAQKIKVAEGDLSVLKGIDNYNIIFDYSNLNIPNYASEEEFLEDKMKIREEKKKGDGERFKQSWLSDRKKLYEPYFINHFNGYFIMKRKIKVYKK